MRSLVRFVCDANCWVCSCDGELVRYCQTMLEERKMWDKWYPA